MSEFCLEYRALNDQIVWEGYTINILVFMQLAVAKVWWDRHSVSLGLEKVRRTAPIVLGIGHYIG